MPCSPGCTSAERSLAAAERRLLSPVQLVCVDVAGTSVSDDGAVRQALRQALVAVGELGQEPGGSSAGHEAVLEAFVEATIDQATISVFRRWFGDDELAHIANDAFERAYDIQVTTGRCTPLPGAFDAIVEMQRAGMTVALITGSSRFTRDLLLEHLGWEDLADLVLSPEDAGRWRPAPDLVLVAALRAGADAMANVAVVGDACSDMECGRRAGAGLVIGVLTGVDTAGHLRAAGADVVCPSITSVPSLVVADPSGCAR